MCNLRRTRRENKELVLLPPLRVPCGRGAEGVPAAIGQLVRPRRRPSSVQAPPRTSSRSCARLELRRGSLGLRNKGRRRLLLRCVLGWPSQRKSKSSGLSAGVVLWLGRPRSPTKVGHCIFAAYLRRGTDPHSAGGICHRRTSRYTAPSRPPVAPPRRIRSLIARLVRVSLARLSHRETRAIGCMSFRTLPSSRMTPDTPNSLGCRMSCAATACSASSASIFGAGRTTAEIEAGKDARASAFPSLLSHSSSFVGPLQRAAPPVSFLVCCLRLCQTLTLLLCACVPCLSRANSRASCSSSSSPRPPYSLFCRECSSHRVANDGQGPATLRICDRCAFSQSHPEHLGCERPLACPRCSAPRNWTQLVIYAQLGVRLLACCALCNPWHWRSASGPTSRLPLAPSGRASAEGQS